MFRRGSLLGLILLIAVIVIAVLIIFNGAGGPQNPVQIKHGSTHHWIDGLWDGLTIFAGLIGNLFRPHRYDVIDNFRGQRYNLAYFIGVMIQAGIWFSFVLGGRKVFT